MRSARSRSSNTRPRPAFRTSALRQILPDDVRIVAHQDHGPVAAPLEQSLVAFGVKPLVADREHLVDQQAFEIDRQRQREHEAGTHARGIGVDRKVELAAKLGEVVDEIEDVPFVPIVEPRDEAGACRAGHVAGHAADETERPGHRQAPIDHAGGRGLHPADQS